MSVLLLNSEDNTHLLWQLAIFNIVEGVNFVAMITLSSGTSICDNFRIRTCWTPQYPTVQRFILLPLVQASRTSNPQIDPIIMIIYWLLGPEEMLVCVCVCVCHLCISFRVTLPKPFYTIFYILTNFKFR